MDDLWYIWFKVYENGRLISHGKYGYAYKYKSNATRRAKQMWSKELYIPMTDVTITREWIVSRTNPWLE